MNKKIAFALVGGISLSLAGCAEISQNSERYENVGYSTSVRENLVGLFKSEIKERYGEPDSYSISYNNSFTMEFMTYKYTAMKFPYETRRMIITLLNGSVSSVNYH